MQVTVRRALWAAAGGLWLYIAAPSITHVLQKALNVHFDQDFTVHAERIIALTHATVIDGTGADAQRDMTLVVRDGRIAALGSSSSVIIPAGATIIDASGKTLLPGFVMVHEHLFYSTGSNENRSYPELFARLYLAGGETTIRTAGTLSPDADLNVRDDIAAGRRLGPDIDVTSPYINDGVGVSPTMLPLQSGADAERMVKYWAARGVTSFKAYTHITRDELKAAIDAAHAAGLKLTGHLCSVTYAEAAGLGIDNLEHGFAVATDFVREKRIDTCPNDSDQALSIAALDPQSEPAQSLFRTLIANHVAVTSTLTVLESVTGDRPRPPQAALDLLTSAFQQSYREHWTTTAASYWGKLQSSAFAANMKLEKAFAEAGGTLLAGTDPTGVGGVLPGFSGKREIELLVEAGFSAPQAVKTATLNGAHYLGRDGDVGSLEVGKRADIVVVDGDAAGDITAIEHMPLVFKAGVGIDTGKVFAASNGKIGL